MNKSYEFKQRVLEEQLFDKLKDSVVLTSHEMRRRYKNVDITRLRTKIINYQIDNYGETIGNSDPQYTKEESLRRAQRSRMRWYMRRKK